jgi:hypothetical protein
MANPARTGFSRMYCHFCSADSLDRSNRSKLPGCHCQRASTRWRTKRLIAAAALPTAASRDRRNQKVDVIRHQDFGDRFPVREATDRFL